MKMKLLLRLNCLVALGVLLILGVGQARADYVYTYTGNDFVGVTTGGPFPDYFSTDQRITASVTR